MTARLLGLVLCLLLQACATPSTRSAAPGDEFLNDAVFADDRFDASADDILASSPDMQRYLRDVIQPEARRHGPMFGLVNALSSTGHLRIDYDSSMTRTAAQTFTARQGNCLSLVLMTAAFASEMGLETRFQRVLTEDIPIADGELLRMVGHVNIVLSKRIASHAQEHVTIDFLAPHDARRLPSEVITIDRVKAMYLNNMAIEALSAGQARRAYWWARASVLQDRGFASAYITLGAIWNRVGSEPMARVAIARALALDPSNSNGRSNLALLEQSAAGSTGASSVPRGLPADRWAVKGKALSRLVPLLKAGDLVGARRLLESALSTERSAEAHLLLAVVQEQLGEHGEASRQLELASKLSTSPQVQALIAKKAGAFSGAAAAPQ